MSNSLPLFRRLEHWHSSSNASKRPICAEQYGDWLDRADILAVQTV
jgi:hypothetical protein